MARVIETTSAAVVAANLERVRAEIAAAGRDPASVEILVAVKYLRAELLPEIAAGGVTLVGENRAQELIAKQAAHPGLFTWAFISALQSRKVRGLLGRARRANRGAGGQAR